MSEYQITRKRKRDGRTYLIVRGGPESITVGEDGPEPVVRLLTRKPKKRVVTPRPERGRARRQRLAQRLRAQGLAEAQIAKKAVRRPR